MQPWDYSKIEQLCLTEKAAFPYQSPINIESPFILAGKIKTILNLLEPNLVFEYT